ncbi:hypothetical protein BC939DRAFT_460089 [Gamsiella multidivaricata]|uniref:uncharacterized protein n=1 Tax=Gamsiella multidivaricata TaxID=101098 RepID=UPI00221FE509|nr:uncharacterized protein BC939DRAFT_460089 [Gamsiella multidivaricata]KAI7819369.1 hypothetical protein BC939DRAFT_460089 [Gamsiella multidivaricata]
MESIHHHQPPCPTPDAVFKQVKELHPTRNQAKGATLDKGISRAGFHDMLIVRADEWRASITCCQCGDPRS